MILLRIGVERISRGKEREFAREVCTTMRNINFTIKTR